MITLYGAENRTRLGDYAEERMELVEPYKNTWFVFLNEMFGNHNYDSIIIHLTK